MSVINISVVPHVACLLLCMWADFIASMLQSTVVVSGDNDHAYQDGVCAARLDCTCYCGDDTNAFSWTIAIIPFTLVIMSRSHLVDCLTPYQSRCLRQASRYSRASPTAIPHPSPRPLIPTRTPGHYRSQQPEDIQVPHKAVVRTGMAA